MISGDDSEIVILILADQEHGWSGMIIGLLLFEKIFHVMVDILQTFNQDVIHFFLDADLRRAHLKTWFHNLEHRRQQILSNVYFECEDDFIRLHSFVHLVNVEHTCADVGLCGSGLFHFLISQK